MAVHIDRRPQGANLVAVRGNVWRAVRVDDAAAVLKGSTRPGRFSAPGQPALYLSGTRAGVWAALHIDTHRSREEFTLRGVIADARAVLDLRDVQACGAAGIDPQDAAGDWRSALAAGTTPRSWNVRLQAQAIGADGLIDPSRHAPGLWHLALFR